MKKLLKTLSFFISAISAIPVIAIDQSKVQTNTVIAMMQEKAQNPLVTPSAQEEYDSTKQTVAGRFNKFFDKPLVYLRGILLTAGSVATLNVIAQHMNFSNSSDIAAYGFACCMGIIVTKEALYNLFGYRINGYITEKV